MTATKTKPRRTVEEIIAQFDDANQALLKACGGALAMVKEVSDFTGVLRRCHALVQAWADEADAQPPTMAGNVTRTVLETRAAQLREAITQGDDR